MKLLSCYIVSFGKLSDIKFDLDDQLTVIKEDNSYGKTTLANFITSMFYGLPDLKVKDLSNDRRRYDPWKGGVYGGTLTFEYEGKKYQIERDFNKKNDAFRLFEVFNSAKKEVFQINGKIIDGTNFGDILFDINKNSFKRSAYIPQDEIICCEIDSGLNDKLRNLINATDENHSLDKSLGILQKAAEAIETKRGKGRLNEINDRISALNIKIEECEICADNSEQGRGRLANLKKSLKGYEEEIERLDNLIKSQNEAEAVLAQQKHYATIKENIKNSEEKIKKLTPFFANQNIETVDLSSIKDKIDAYKKQEAVLKDTEDNTLTERSKLQSLEEASIARQERKEVLRTQITGFENDKKRVLDEKIKLETERSDLKKSHQERKSVLFILLCIFTFGLYYVITKNKNKQVADKIAGLQKLIDDCDNKLMNIDIHLGGIKKQIDEIVNSSINQDNQNKLSDLKAMLLKENELLQQLKIELDKILEPFICSSKDYIERFHEIKEYYYEIKTAQHTLNENQTKLSEFLKDKDITKLTSKIETGFSASQLQIEKFKADQERLKCIKEIAETENRINKNDEIADDLSDYESELSSYKENKELLINELDIIKKTIDFLKEANDNLANQYLTPLLERSRDIIKLYDEQKSDLEFDVNSKILVKEMGMDRELGYFSKGIKELISICMRFSLLDIIFKDNSKKPFVILDDPFVNLDDKKLKTAKGFIKKLSEKYQIIYLTCHESREISI